MGIIIAVQSAVFSNILKQHLKDFHLSHLTQTRITPKQIDKMGNYCQLISSGRPIELIETQSGKNVLHLVNTEPIDLIILDWELSDQSGLEVFQQVKRASQTPPILMITRDIENRPETLIRHGVNDILVRPYVRSDLQKKVSKLLQQQSIYQVGQRCTLGTKSNATPSANWTDIPNWTDINVDISPSFESEEIVYTVPRQQAKVSGDSFKIVEH